MSELRNDGDIGRFANSKHSYGNEYHSDNREEEPFSHSAFLLSSIILFSITYILSMPYNYMPRMDIMTPLRGEICESNP